MKGLRRGLLLAWLAAAAAGQADGPQPWSDETWDAFGALTTELGEAYGIATAVEPDELWTPKHRAALEQAIDQTELVVVPIRMAEAKYGQSPEWSLLRSVAYAQATELAAWRVAWDLRAAGTTDPQALHQLAQGLVTDQARLNTRRIDLLGSVLNRRRVP